MLLLLKLSEINSSAQLQGEPALLLFFGFFFLWCAFGSPHNQIIKMFKKLFEKFIVCIKLLLSEVKGYE